MKNLLYLTLSFVSLTLFTSLAYAQNPEEKQSNKASVQEEKQEYLLLVEKAKRGDQTIDFGRLRTSYLDWVNNKCNQTEPPNRDGMVKAFEQKDWQKALQLGEKVLDYEFTNRGLHLAMANAYKELQNSEKEQYHTEIAQKLLKALLDSGDGKTPKTAYKVHSIREEYIVMRELGYRVSSQALVMDNDYGSFDVLTGENAEKKTASFYFSINSFFGGGNAKPCPENEKKQEKKN